MKYSMEPIPRKVAPKVRLRVRDQYRKKWLLVEEIWSWLGLGLGLGLELARRKWLLVGEESMARLMYVSTLQ